MYHSKLVSNRNRLMLSHLTLRQERVYLAITGIFLSTLTVINVLGLSRFIDLTFSLGSMTVPMHIPLGVLPYPITFLCTDIVTELYGKARAKQMVWIGLLVSIWIFGMVWASGFLPPYIEGLPSPIHPDYTFFKMRLLTLSSIAGSLIAYLVAQLLGVHLFQLCKNFTKGKHLWFRNNVSTCISQFVDTFIVTSVAFCFSKEWMSSSLMVIVFGSYTFKIMATLFGTLPFYFLVTWLKHYFGQTATSFSKQPSLNIQP